VKQTHSIVGVDHAFLDPSYRGRPQTLRVLGLRLHCLSYDEMHHAFDWWISDKGRPSLTVALVNVNCSVSALSDPLTFRCYQSVGIRGIDSMPFLWLGRALTRRTLDRLYAPDMMLEVARRAQSMHYKFFLMGGMPGAAETISTMLRERYPGVQIVGTYTPPFRPLTGREDEDLVAMINTAQPDFVWVGLGSPKQDLWIQEHRQSIRGAVLIASGATFDFLSGRIRQAPKWIRNSGFEWLFRLCQDTRRLWRRYTIYNLYFLFWFLLEVMGLKTWEKSSSPAGKS
jgi:N-acetylglucosaminyldiphosphoundecaprenol N-acetyl-beta-D-mannosaminyltransferase